MRISIDGRQGGRLCLGMVMGLMAAAFFSCQVWAATESRLPGDIFRDCADCAELVIVPEGEFTMGSAEKPSEGPPHHVVIRKSFAIGRQLITVAEWQRCVAAGACKYTPQDSGPNGDLPVTNLSWDDTQQFAAWISKLTGKTYRLPSEAEWEYAARAGSTTPYWWGKDVGQGHAQCADCGGAAPGKPSKAGAFRPNAFGLYDTAGNAAEWVLDCWNPSFKGAPADGSAWMSGDCSLRVLRGGSFADKASALRSSARFRYDEDVRYYANGFRLVRELN